MPSPFLTAGLALVSGVAATVGDVPVQTPVEVVDVVSQPYARMTVPVSIQGTGPYRFLIDTGAQATVLSREIAEKLQLNDRRPAVLIGATSRAPVETIAVDGIQLGSRTFNVPLVPVVDGANIGGADGVLGLDSLQGQRVLLDFRHKAMLVADARTLGGNRGYEIVVRAQRRLGQLIITQARLDGVNVSVIIDTGAQGSTGNMALFQRLRRMRSPGDGTMTDINGVSLSAPIHIARELQVDRVSLSNVPILFTDSPTFAALGLDKEPSLILGMEQLRLFNRVAIDFATQKVLFDLDIPSGFSITSGSASRLDNRGI